jgi:hypothetical protein
MQHTNKQLRDQLRLVHILASVILGAYIYSPWRSNQTYAIAMSFAIFPILAFTELWMWQVPRIKKWIKQIPSSFPPEKLGIRILGLSTNSIL